MNRLNFFHEIFTKAENLEPVSSKGGPSLFQHFYLGDVARLYRSTLQKCLLSCQPRSREAIAIFRAINDVDKLRCVLDDSVCRLVGVETDTRKLITRVYFGDPLMFDERYRLAVLIALHDWNDSDGVLQ